MSPAELAQWCATMGILEALLQMEVCGHGTRGFCKDCVRLMLFEYPISVRDQGKQ